MSATVPMRDGKSNPKLLDQVCDVMRLKHYSLRTERTYCDRIERRSIQYSSKVWAGVLPKC